ncbi:MAG: DUF488 domain-containing protein [Phycisphaerae bacterium]
MLKRQRCLLYMIERAGRPVTHFELTKWSFLLAHEMPSGGGAAFYQFLPYQRGPFSFCLYREAGVLVRNGYLLDHGKSWRLVEDVPRPTDDLPTLVRADAARVVERFGGQAQDELMDYVYGHFPWFTVNSNARKLDSRPVGTAAICTAGYEGWQVDGFLNMLMRAGIQRLLDVRNNPVARRYGFHKSTLGRLCGKVGIEYLHFPELGIPSDLRRELTGPADYGALLAQYETGTLGRETGAVGKVAQLTREKPSVLMCMEADPQRCHRSRLAKVVQGMTALPVHHLGADDESRV